MPSIVRKGDLCSGHADYPPRASIKGSSNVFINGKPAHRKGDYWAVHTNPQGASHDGVASSGSSTVFVNGSPVCRLGDSISCGSTMAEGSDNVFADGNNFSVMREELEKKATEKEKLLLCIPDIAEAESNRAQNERDKRGWAYLKEFLGKWFTGEASTDKEVQPPSFVDWEWLLKYEEVQNRWDEIADKNYLFSDNARAKLYEVLSKDALLKDTETNFNYIDIPFAQWREKRFQETSVQKKDYIKPNPPRSLLAAMELFPICALAKGRVMPIQNRHKIIVEEVAFFIQDHFDFEGEHFLLGLGNWDCENKSFLGIIGGTRVKNIDFRNFRNNHNVGSDFFIFTRPKKLDLKVPEEYFV